MKRKVYYILLIFIICIFIGYFGAVVWTNMKNYSKVAVENTIDNSNTEVVETASTGEKVSPNSSFALKKYYTECVHFSFQYSELPVELVNLTKEQIEDMYDDWIVEELRDNSLVLAKKIDGICDEHYYIKLGNEYIEIYSVEKDKELKLYKETDISREYLTEEDIKVLEEGFYIFGKGKLNSVIEDFE